MHWKLSGLCLGVALTLPQMASANDDLMGLDLQSLMALDVMSASKKMQPISDTAAAVAVLTGEDIRRMGATSIPEALRFAPGLQVMRISNDKWSVSVRGFSGVYSNKLLVLVDGRSVYSPIFAGTYWEALDVDMGNIDRIEVIRGSGGTLWGANAVNGVINIITKRAADTQGSYAQLTQGNYDHSENFRYGGKLGENAYFRINGSLSERDPYPQAFDGSNDKRLGMRLDWNIDTANSISLKGTLYEGNHDQRLQMPTKFTDPLQGVATVLDDAKSRSTEQFLQVNWKRHLVGGGDMEWQAYLERTNHAATGGPAFVTTADIDGHYHFHLNDWNDMVAGMGYRAIEDDMKGIDIVTYNPVQRDTHVASAFIQDEMSLLQDELRLTLGSKFEHNSYSGFEAQPNARLLWKPSEQHRWWGAVSRAVRTPARFDADGRIDVARWTSGAVMKEISIFGNRNVQPETLMAYELGYRFLPDSRKSLDVSLFWNSYENLITRERGTPFNANGIFVIPVNFRNLGEADSYGMEVSGNWQVSNNWRLTGSYSYMTLDFHRQAGSNDIPIESSRERADAHNVAQLRSQYNLLPNLELDANLYYMSRTEWYDTDGTHYKIDGYSRFDLRLGWQPKPKMEVELIGQNLLDGGHVESAGGQGILHSEIPRTVLGRLTLKF